MGLETKNLYPWNLMSEGTFYFHIDECCLKHATFYYHQQPTETKHQTYLVFPVFVSHSQRVVSQLVRFTLLRFHNKPVRTRPVFSVYDWFELPQLVSSVYHHQILGLFVSDMRAKVLHLLEGRYTRAHACQCQLQR